MERYREVTRIAAPGAGPGISIDLLVSACRSRQRRAGERRRSAVCRPVSGSNHFRIGQKTLPMRPVFDFDWVDFKLGKEKFSHLQPRRPIVIDDDLGAAHAKLVGGEVILSHGQPANVRVEYIRGPAEILQVLHPYLGLNAELARTELDRPPDARV